MDFLLKTSVFLAAFIVCVVLRKQTTRRIKKIRLPTIVLYVLLATPLIIFEEQINCMASWCGKVLIPPTLPFLLIELLIVYVLWKLLRLKRILPPILLYSLFGIAWELLLGGLKGAAEPPLIFGFFIIWVGISYAFVILLPISLLEKPK